MEFHDNLKDDSYIGLLENGRKKYEKVGAVADNTRTLTGKMMRDYMANANGDMVIMHIPHTAAEPYGD